MGPPQRGSQAGRECDIPVMPGPGMGVGLRAFARWFVRFLCRPSQSQLGTRTPLRGGAAALGASGAASAGTAARPLVRCSPPRRKAHPSTGGRGVLCGHPKSGPRRFFRLQAQNVRLVFFLDFGRIGYLTLMVTDGTTQ